MPKTIELPLGKLPKDDEARPLADRMRPLGFDEVIGQEHLFAEGSLFANAIKSGEFPSIIFWGPPGCGKTTLARLIAKNCNALFVPLSAISSNVADLRRIFDQARMDKDAGKRTLLLVDEIHHFNRSQQDIFLPYIENGTIILIGATTENPSFELNSALLSRCKVMVLNRLSHDELKKLMTRAEEFSKKFLPLDDDAYETLAAIADGDGRYLLNICEELFKTDAKEKISSDALLKIVGRRMPIYDKSRDGHYNLISALHKSLRGSDVDAALYWFARMLDGGDDPLYITRRLVRFASEDIGNADPNALVITLAAKDAYDFLGSPEGELSIAQAVIYLATAPKSNASYVAFNQVMKDAKQTGSLMPPKHILNAPTKLMKNENYGENYIYDHDTKEGFSGQNYFPDGISRREYYHPVERGFERDIKKRMEYWKGLRDNKKAW